MCPPSYHHNGIIAARELGHTMYNIKTNDKKLRFVKTTSLGKMAEEMKLEYKHIHIQICKLNTME